MIVIIKRRMQSKTMEEPHRKDSMKCEKSADD